MFRRILLPLLACLTLPTIAVAQSTSYKIVGRGIQDADTGDSIALVCVGAATPTEGPACDRIQHYFFSGKTFEAKPIGRVYELKFTGHKHADKVMKIKLRQISKDYRQFHHNDPKVRKRRLYIGIGLMVFAVGILPASHLLYYASNDVFLGVIFGLTFAGMHIADRGDRALTGNEGTSVPFVTQTFADERGWNWASSPKAIKSKKFRYYVKFLRSMRTGELTADLPAVEDVQSVENVQSTAINVP